MISDRVLYDIVVLIDFKFGDWSRKLKKSHGVREIEAIACLINDTDLNPKNDEKLTIRFHDDFHIDQVKDVRDKKNGCERPSIR